MVPSDLDRPCKKENSRFRLIMHIVACRNPIILHGRRISGSGDERHANQKCPESHQSQRTGPTTQWDMDVAEVQGAYRRAGTNSDLYRRRVGRCGKRSGHGFKQLHNDKHEDSKCECIYPHHLHTRHASYLFRRTESGVHIQRNGRGPTVSGCVERYNNTDFPSWQR